MIKKTWIRPGPWGSGAAGCGEENGGAAGPRDAERPAGQRRTARGWRRGRRRCGQRGGMRGTGAGGVRGGRARAAGREAFGGPARSPTGARAASRRSGSITELGQTRSKTEKTRAARGRMGAAPRAENI